MATSSIYGDSTGQNNTSLYEKYLKGDMTVVDPYTRSLLEAGLSKGQAFDILTPEGYEAQRQARASQLQAAVVDPLRAAEETDARKIQGFYEKTGKLASSASTADLMRSSEQYRANIASELAKANLSIYEQLDTQRAGQFERLYGSGVARTQAETGLYESALGSETQRNLAAIQQTTAYAQMGSQEKIAFANMSSDMQIAQLQAQTQKEVARIQADTTLSVADKQARVAQLNNESDQAIAQLQATTQTSIAGMQTTSAENIATLQTSTQKIINEANITSAEKISANELAQQMTQWKINTEQSAAEFWANMGLEYKKYETNKAMQEALYALEVDKFNQAAKEWKVNTETDYEKFTRTMDLAYAQYGTDKAMQEALFSLERDKFTQAISEWKVGTEEQSRQFWATFDEGVRRLNIDKAMQEAYYAEGMRQFDLTRADQVKQVGDALAWDKEKAQTMLTEQARQFNVSTANDMTKYIGTLQTTIDQFNVTVKEQHDYAAATLRLQANQVKDSDIANYLNYSAALLQSPIMLTLDNEMRGGDGKTELERVTDNLFQVSDKMLVEALTSKTDDITLGTLGQVNVDAIIQAAMSGDPEVMKNMLKGAG